jgi:hypothetical protein
VVAVASFCVAVLVEEAVVGVVVVEVVVVAGGVGVARGARVAVEVAVAAVAEYHRFPGGRSPEVKPNLSSQCEGSGPWSVPSWWQSFELL